MFEGIKYLILLILMVSFVYSDEAQDSISVKFVKLIELNDTSKLARYDYNVTNLNETVVAIFAEGELLVELNDEWQIQLFLYNNPDGKEEFVEAMKTPRIGMCAYWQTIYKQYFYEGLKDTSNLPHYDTCPLPAFKFWIHNYIFNGADYQSMMGPGLWKLAFSLYHNDALETGIELFVMVTIK